MTLETVFDPYKNSLNAIRLALAALVIVSHSWALGGFGPEPELGGANLGTWAVLGFFGISGYLITASRLSGKSTATFYRKRILRIVPGFVVCIALVAAVFAPLSLLLDSSAKYSVGSAVSYFFRNLALYPAVGAQEGIGTTLANVPYPGVWDGPLYTLFWEASCYVLIGVIVSLVRPKHIPALLGIGFVGLTAVLLVIQFSIVHMPGRVERVAPMFLAFIAGSLLLIFKDKVRTNRAWVLVAVAIVAISMATGSALSVAPLPFAYLLIVAGSWRGLQRVGAVYDASYGMYIYGWPVQQFVALVFGRALPLPAFIALSLVGTLPLAYLSCRFIEVPARSLRFGSRRGIRQNQKASV